MRLQEYGVGIFNTVPTKSSLKKALKKECITVNDVGASTATIIKGGELIKLYPIPEVRPAKELRFELEVLYEDDYLAAVHKPAGILVSGNTFYTVQNALEQNLKPSTQSDAVRPKPVHRLDYATTGVLLIGKTASAIRELSGMFADKQIHKTYVAIVIGELTESGTLESEVDSKPASTDYKVLDSVFSERFGSLSYLKLHPKTGRKHQLRVQLSENGNPILGDKDYSPEHLILKGKGMYLHAHSINFSHPFTSENLEIQDNRINRFIKIFPR